MADQRIMPSAEVVLLGAGHNHLEVIKKYGEMRKKPFRLTLVSESCMGSYKGFLGRLLRKEVSQRKAFLDLGHFCLRNDVRYLKEKISTVDVLEKQIYCEQSSQSLHFDVVSFDLGLESPEFCEHQDQISPVMIPRPPGIFYQKLLDFEIQIRTKKPRDFSLVFTGGDLSSVEILFSLWDRFRHDELLQKIKFTFLNLDPWQSEHRHKLWKFFEKRLILLGINYISNAGVDGWDSQSRELILENGERLKTDLLIHAFGGQGHPILAKTDLALDKRGLIRVNPNLESSSHPGVYAVGSSVSWGYPCGVNSRLNYQSKMGAVLFANLLKRFKGLHQIQYQSPSVQAQYIYCGNRKSVVCFNQRFFSADWITSHKASKDDLWRKRYKPAVMKFHPPTYLESGNKKVEPCYGTGDELPGSLTEEVFRDKQSLLKSELRHSKQTPNHKGFGTSSTGLVLSTDYQRSFSKDNYTFARVFASHCVSRMLVTGVMPTQAQLIFSVGYGPAEIMKRDLADLSEGILDELIPAGIAVAGTHTHASIQSGLGMTLSGIRGDEQKNLWNATKIEAGIELVLTKPLGTGIVLAGFQNQYVSSEDYYSCLNTMALSHVKIYKLLKTYNPSLALSIEGSGLLLTLYERLGWSKCRSMISLDLSRINLFQGVSRALKLGVRSGLHSQNRIKFTKFLQSLKASQRNKAEVIFDPQTSGGLLVAIEKGQGAPLVTQLKEHGFESAAIIGESLEMTSESLDRRIQII